MTTADNISPERKAALIEKYHDINVEDDFPWYECVFEDFHAEMSTCGVEVEDILFSGFWSQGDGACFSGNVYDWSKLFDAMGYCRKEDAVLYRLADEHWSAHWWHRGHYYHEGCVHFAFDSAETGAGYSCPDAFVSHYAPNDIEEGTLQATAWAAALSQYDPDAICEHVEGFMKDKMRELYKRLEDEYYYLTSEEVVWETIVNSELHIEDEDQAADTAA